MADVRITAKLTREKVGEVLDYDPLSGVFTWKVYRTGKSENDGRVHPGDEAGDINSHGYRRICVFYHRVTAHRLAVLMMTGRLPHRGEQIDHINGDRADNRWANLRLATNGQNQMNAKRRQDNTSGARGVSFCKNTSKWYAYINVEGKRLDLGRFEAKQDAIAARLRAQHYHYGEFARDERSAA
jgi:hypothetical protein